MLLYQRSQTPPRFDEAWSQMTPGDSLPLSSISALVEKLGPDTVSRIAPVVGDIEAHFGKPACAISIVKEDMVALVSCILDDAVVAMSDESDVDSLMGSPVFASPATVDSEMEKKSMRMNEKENESESENENMNMNIENESEKENESENENKNESMNMNIESENENENENMNMNIEHENENMIRNIEHENENMNIEHENENMNMKKNMIENENGKNIHMNIKHHRKARSVKMGHIYTASPENQTSLSSPFHSPSDKHAPFSRLSAEVSHLRQCLSDIESFYSRLNASFDRIDSDISVMRGRNTTDFGNLLALSAKNARMSLKVSSMRAEALNVAFQINGVKNGLQGIEKGIQTEPIDESQEDSCSESSFDFGSSESSDFTCIDHIMPGTAREFPDSLLPLSVFLLVVAMLLGGMC